MEWTRSTFIIIKMNILQITPKVDLSNTESELKNIKINKIFVVTMIFNLG